MIFQTTLTQVLHSNIGLFLIIVFFSFILLLLSFVFGFATRGENRRAQGLNQKEKFFR